MFRGLKGKGFYFIIANEVTDKFENEVLVLFYDL